MLDINAIVTKNGDKCQAILGMHALSGCATLSYPNGKGKVSALKVLNQTDIIGLNFWCMYRMPTFRVYTFLP